MKWRSAIDKAEENLAGTPAGGAVSIDPKLMACRDMSLQLLLQSFDGFFDTLEEDFLSLAEKSTERHMRDCYFAARAETQAKRALLKSEFRQYFLNVFNQRIRELESSESSLSRHAQGQASAEWALIGDEEYEENLTINNMANKFKSFGGEDLRQLESRLARLVPMGDDQEMNNPISPDTICEAFRCACRQIESGADARLVALRAFEQQFVQQMAGIYRQVNEFLVQQNVQPVVSRSRQKSVARERLADAPASSGTDQFVANPHLQGGQASGAADGDLPPGMVSITLPAALASHLDHLLSGQPTGDFNNPVARNATGMVFLDQLQHRLLDPDMELDGVAIHPAQDNLVALLQNTQWAQNLAQMDAMTLNLVALLFDRLFEDSRLPDAIKGLIGRLQIPVLKVALLDSTFFARKSHPARQLVDRLAEEAIDWHEGKDSQRFDKFSAIVSWVVANFEGDVSIFEQALSDLESFLMVEADAAANQILDDTEVLAAAELNELGLATAESVVGARLFKRDVPVLVVDFVRQWWVPALAQAYGPAGEHEPRFAAYVAALDELLWSVEPKRGPEERLGLVNCLPGMLKTIEEGTAAAGMPVDVRQAFMSELVHCHAAAIRNGMRPPAPIVSPVLAVTPESTTSQSEIVDDFEPVSSDDYPARWEWVDLLEENGHHAKLRLTWVSPQKTRFLFTNRDGGNGHTFTRVEIDALLRSGRLQRESLSDGLTCGVLAQLRNNLAA